MDIKLRTANRPVTDADTLDWNTVYRQLLPKVYRYFCYKVGEGQLAEDLTATTFEKAWKKRRRYRRNLSAFSTWVFTIARNVAIDFFRTSKEADSLPSAPIPDSAAPTPEEQLTTRDDFARLAELVRNLTERNQEILILKYGAELSQREIAELTGLTQTNVGVILHRAVKQLRNAWEANDA